MNPEHGRGVIRMAAAVSLTLLFSVSCASKPSAIPTTPAAKAAPAQVEAPVRIETPARTETPVGSDAPSGTPATPARDGSGGTALKTADPATLARGREEREAIESSIVYGSPSSLARARELALQATALKAEDVAALDALALGIEALAYPVASDAPRAEAEAARPGTALGLLKSLGEAAAGHFPAVPPEAAGSPLGELIPALALFYSDSSETTRRAVDALDRFSRLGVPSIMPGILRGVDAERRGDWQGALGLYRSVLAIAPDAWIATLGSGRALLALKRNADSLAALQTLAGARSGLHAFDRPYAIALCANGRYSDADPYVSRVLTRDPLDSKFLLLRARLLIRGKSYQLALPLLDAYGTVDPSDRLYLLLRCLESEALRAREEALKWARRGLASYPDDPELLAAASRLLFAGPAFGREEARSLAQRVCEIVVPGAPAPADTDGESGAVILAARNAAGAEASRLLALDAAGRFKWAEAASHLPRAGASFEDKALASRILRKAGNARAALDYASAWYNAEPRSEDAAEAWLRALIDSGDEKAAQEAIARLLPGASSPPFRSVLYLLQSKMQKSDEAALGLLHSALMENADSPEALVAVFDIQFRRKDFAKARFYLKQAIAINPGDPEYEARQRQLDATAAQ